MGEGEGEECSNFCKEFYYYNYLMLSLDMIFFVLLDHI